jgi:hypothetical protein
VTDERRKFVRGGYMCSDFFKTLVRTQVNNIANNSAQVVRDNCQLSLESLGNITNNKNLVVVIS